MGSLSHSVACTKIFHIECHSSIPVEAISCFRDTGKVCFTKLGSHNSWQWAEGKGPRGLLGYKDVSPPQFQHLHGDFFLPCGCIAVGLLLFKVSPFFFANTHPESNTEAGPSSARFIWNTSLINNTFMVILNWRNYHLEKTGAIRNPSPPQSNLFAKIGSWIAMQIGRWASITVTYLVKAIYRQKLMYVLSGKPAPYHLFNARTCHLPPKLAHAPDRPSWPEPTSPMGGGCTDFCLDIHSTYFFLIKPLFHVELERVCASPLPDQIFFPTIQNAPIPNLAIRPVPQDVLRVPPVREGGRLHNPGRSPGLFSWSRHSSRAGCNSVTCRDLHLGAIFWPRVFSTLKCAYTGSECLRGRIAQHQVQIFVHGEVNGELFLHLGEKQRARQYLSLVCLISRYNFFLAIGSWQRAMQTASWTSGSFQMILSALCTTRTSRRGWITWSTGSSNSLRSCYHPSVHWWMRASQFYSKKTKQIFRNFESFAFPQPLKLFWFFSCCSSSWPLRGTFTKRSHLCPIASDIFFLHKTGRLV